MENKVSASLGEDDYKIIMDAIQTVKERLPFLLSLSAQERQRLTKFGDKSRSFAGKALEVATQYPNFLPGTFDLADLQKDVKLYDQLASIETSLSQLEDMLEATCLQTGAEVMRSALGIYQALKGSADSLGLGPILADLSMRFARTGSGKAAKQGSSG